MENDGATKREKARKILLEQFLAGKHKESGFRDVVIAENRELMPELEEEFLKLEKTPQLRCKASIRQQTDGLHKSDYSFSQWNCGSM